MVSGFNRRLNLTPNELVILERKKVPDTIFTIIFEKDFSAIGYNEQEHVHRNLDGEGTITLTRKSKGAQRHLAITISSTERNLLQYVKDILGAGLISSKRTYKTQHSAAYAFRVSNRQALSILAQIIPFLRTYKKERAALVIRDYLKMTPRDGKYSIETLEKRDKFVQSFFKILPDNGKQ